MNLELRERSLKGLKSSPTTSRRRMSSPAVSKLSSCRTRRSTEAPSQCLDPRHQILKQREIEL